MKQDDVRLVPISNGTVLDHLPPGSALRIIKILGLDKVETAVTLAMHTESASMKIKDLVFIEGKELSEEEISKVGLIAAGATLNLIKDGVVKKKAQIGMPNHADGLIKCMNSKCITKIEGLPSKFSISKDPLKAKCRYCEKEMNESEIFKVIK
ncbi:MAG: aspartate carbamoyltransferase regulatory subunit [Candidatus Diapherotrites archaeon]|uniref:Aspartate carbamoyltransferase regulatory chain n=1 Tax=Candidatus Iainarchaeum sp. TaxID=3101447 RepID=A0A2D6M109_9ARCH|nr:aspartate carbamoyltransferase regulatory subunit [Candidatus Diapherotrites archaeon]